MLKYKKNLKIFSRDLRNNMTNAEILLWSRLRKKQVLGLCFYRQKPLLSYIADFYCHQIKLVIECDGSQHFEDEYILNDKEREAHLNSQGIYVLRFDNLQIMKELEAVMTVIESVARGRMLGHEIPLVTA